MQNNGFAAPLTPLWAVALRAFFSPRENSVRPNFPGGLQLILRAFSFLLSAEVSSSLPSPFLSLRSNFPHMPKYPPRHATPSLDSARSTGSHDETKIVIFLPHLYINLLTPPPPPPPSENSSRWFTCWSVVCLILLSKSNPEVPSASPFRLPSVFPLFSPYSRVFFFFLGSYVFPSYS